MIFALAVAFLSVFLGTWLALGPQTGTRLLGTIRVVSIVAALGVIATHLLPEAFHGLGVRALFGFAGGALLPSLAEILGKSLAQRGSTAHDHGGALAALEIGYAGLVAHRSGAGLSMGAYARTSDSTWSMVGVILALAAHVVPVTTVMIFAVLSLRGRRSAIVRAGRSSARPPWRASSSRARPSTRVREGDVSSWISAIVAGLLLPHRHPRRQGPTRASRPRREPKRLGHDRRRATRTP